MTTRREQLAKSLHHIDPEVRWIAIQELTEAHGVRYTDLIAEALFDRQYTSIRWRAAVALGERRDPRAVDALVTALSDENYHVREAVAESLGLIGDERAVPALIRALHDPVRSVRLRVIRSLEQIGGPGVEALNRVLEEENLSCQEAVDAALEEMGESQKQKS